jgi:hypothetical protein
MKKARYFLDCLVEDFHLSITLRMSWGSFGMLDVEELEECMG